MGGSRSPVLLTKGFLLTSIVRVIDDDVDKVIQKISNADGIVLGSPTYASNVSGLMKDFWSCSYQSSF